MPVCARGHLQLREKGAGGRKLRGVGFLADLDALAVGLGLAGQLLQRLLLGVLVLEPRVELLDRFALQHLTAQSAA